MLEEYLRNNKDKTHFLFFYYLIKNQIEKAVELYPDIKNLSLLETVLKNNLKRLPSAQKRNIFEKFPFLNKKDNDEMIFENNKEENVFNEVNFDQEIENNNKCYLFF